MKVAVVGTGYVGLVTGAVLAHLGNNVICVDKDHRKLDLIKSGKSPIFEPGLEEILQRTTAEGLLQVSDDIAASVKESDLVFIAVGTPPGENGTPDLTAVEAVARAAAHGIDRYKVIVNKSTVPVGSGDLVARIIQEEGISPTLFDVVSNPEFLREGSAVRDTMEPDRIVIGASSLDAAQVLVDLYRPLDRPVQITDVNSAELIKYASNSFLAMKISFINAMSILCEECGANITDVAKGMGSDKRIGPAFLQAGLGWGGSCFPKDVLGLIAIAEQMGYDFELLQAVWDINQNQTHRFLYRLSQRLGGLQGKTIALLGLAFKPNTDDIRDAKSLVVLDHLLKSGAVVRAYDPAASNHVKPLFPTVNYCKSAYAAAEGADAVILITEWSEFKQMDLVKLGSVMKSKILFDGRRIYDPSIPAKAGFEYYTIGLKSQ